MDGFSPRVHHVTRYLRPLCATTVLPAYAAIALQAGRPVQPAGALDDTEALGDFDPLGDCPWPAGT